MKQIVYKNYLIEINWEEKQLFISDIKEKETPLHNRKTLEAFCEWKKL